MKPLLSLEIKGSLPSMKNQRRIVLNRRTGKPFSIKSSAAEEYERSFAHQIARIAPQKPLPATISLSIKVRVWYKTRASDLDIEFLKDLLQKYGIIENDRSIVHQESWKGHDKDNPRVLCSLYEAKG